MNSANLKTLGFLAPTLLAVSITAGGCQWMAPQSRPGDLDVEHVDPTTLQEEYRKLSAFADRAEAERARAQQALVRLTLELENERDASKLVSAELEATLIDLHYLESQFISLESQLAQEESRATAVAAMADAQLIYDRIRQTESALLTSREWQQVDERMAAAETAAAQNKYTAAVYYAHRAMRTLNHSERQSKSFLSSGSPRVVSVAVANYREGPGPEFTVLGTVPYGMVIVEIERKVEWIRMKTRSGSEGWIHEDLIR